MSGRQRGDQSTSDKQRVVVMHYRGQGRFFFFLAMCFGCGIYFLKVFRLPEVKRGRQPNVTFDQSRDGQVRLAPVHDVRSRMVANGAIDDGHQKNDQLPLTVNIMGRLGNTMFQYASLVGVARMNEREAFVLSNSSLANVFRLTHLKSRAIPDDWRWLKERASDAYDLRLERLPEVPVFLRGYFQSYKYFEDVHSEIRREFTFLPSIQLEARNVFERIRSSIDDIIDVDDYGVRIGVHVRRGDMMRWRNVRLRGPVAPASYFHKAFQWMRAKYRRVVFLVASDDLGWVKDELEARDVIALPEAEGEVHLCVLTQCDHVIISVGSFGWWAGWLAGGDVIYFDKSNLTDSRKDTAINHGDYFPKHWIALRG